MSEPHYSASSLLQYMRCPRRYYWSHVRRLALAVEPAAPSFGAAIHTGLNAWYERHDVDGAVRVFNEHWSDRLDDTLHTRVLGERILRGYAERYAIEPFRVLALEREFSYHLPNGLLYVGRFDGVIEWDGMMLVMDHKTTSRLGPSYFRRFRPDFQFTGYCWAAQQMFGRPARGILVNAIYKSKTRVEYVRDIVPREPFEIEQFERMAVQLTNEIELARAKDVMDAFPMRWNACNDWGSCVYRDLCTTDEPERLVPIMYVERPDTWGQAEVVLEDE